MESVEVTVRKLRPQPIGTATASGFDAWRQLLVDEVNRIDRIRSVDHQIGARLRNMNSFIKQQIALITRVEGQRVLVKVGEFHWFLVKLLQRQEGMKAQIVTGDPHDPFIRELDPGLRDCIKVGWGVVTFPKSFRRLIDQLTRAGRGAT